MAQQLINWRLVDVDPFNPRGVVGDVSELVASIRVRGQEDPVQLIPKPGGRFWLHEGHRRRAAMLELGLTTVWYVTREFASEKARLLSQGTLHLHRISFDPIAWAEYLHRLFWKHNMNRQDLAHHLGCSQKWVRDTMSLVHLQEQEKKAVTAGLLTKGEALWRLGNRRALRDGTLPPAPAPRTPSHREQHLTGRHPLATTVKALCVASGKEHRDRVKIGGVGCGECWEKAIRDDTVAGQAQPQQMALAA